MEKTDKQKTPSSKKKHNQLNSFLRYSNLAIQMALTIGLLGFLGYKVDQWLSLKFPIFLILFILIAFVGIMYKLMRILNAKD